MSLVSPCWLTIWAVPVSILVFKGDEVYVAVIWYHSRKTINYIQTNLEHCLRVEVGGKRVPDNTWGLAPSLIPHKWLKAWLYGPPRLIAPVEEYPAVLDQLIRSKHGQTYIEDVTAHI